MTLTELRDQTEDKLPGTCLMSKLPVFSLQLPFEKEIYYIQHSMLYLVPLYLFRKGGMASVFLWLGHDGHAGLQYLFYHLCSRRSHQLVFPTQTNVKFLRAAIIDEAALRHFKKTFHKPCTVCYL